MREKKKENFAQRQAKYSRLNQNLSANHQKKVPCSISSNYKQLSALLTGRQVRRRERVANETCCGLQREPTGTAIVECLEVRGQDRDKHRSGLCRTPSCPARNGCRNGRSKQWENVEFFYLPLASWRETLLVY
jgi:hypothetical protein